MSRARLARISMLAALCGPACDSFYGVSRVAEIQSIPDPACVGATLEAVAGVSNVREGHARQPSGAPTGFIAESHDYYFTVEGAPCQLSIDTPHLGHVRLMHESLTKYPVSQARVDRVRRAMSEIERQLEVNCGVENLAERVVETCFNVKCDDSKSGDRE